MVRSVPATPDLIHSAPTDDELNNIFAAGALCAALRTAGGDVTVVYEDCVATNVLSVNLGMLSRYRVTVEREPDDG